MKENYSQLLCEIGKRFAFIEAISVEQINLCKELRHKIYCEEFKWEPETTSGLEINSHDELAKHYLMFDRVIDSLKVNYLSIHGLGGSSMIKAATKASNFTKILTVSLLSHHDQKSINEIGIKNSLKNEIKKLINNALKNNVHGLILAPKDLEKLKQIKKKKKIEVFVPGIRPKKIKKNEHKRSLGHLDAIKKGANYIIVGRPITKSKNPKKMLKLINEEIKQYLKKE